jgi:Uncharacterised protein family (UPF0236)
MSYRGLVPKTFVSSLGDITVGRRYYASRDCSCKAVPWDPWSGIMAGHKLTLQARRMVTLAGSGCSFDEAAEKLRELCHFQVSNDVVRRVCDEEGEEAAQWLKESPAPVAAMADAKGELEFYSDGVQVKTVEGWRELRVSVFAKREAAEPAEPAQWESRTLEKPACRLAWAAIEASDQIGASWQAMLEHLGLQNSPRLSVLGDGARWIWDEAAKRFKAVVNVDWVVDVYHVCEKIQTCAKEMFGVGFLPTKAWATARVEELIRLEGPRFIESLEKDRQAATDPKSHDPLDALIGYLKNNRDSLWYRTRLSQGLPIGSGLVEGTCKNMIGKRLKLNNPAWKVPRAANMAALRCLHYSKLWEPFWESKRLPKVA